MIVCKAVHRASAQLLSLASTLNVYLSRFFYSFINRCRKVSLSIKEKLRFLDRPAAETKGNVPDQQASISELQLLPDCRIIENEYGRCILREKKFPLSFQHGKTQLHKFMDLPAKFFAFIGNNSSFGELHKKGLLFLDTETTGLAGGTGTLIFLIGLGYFEEEHFCVKQFLLFDPSDEKAFLSEIEKHLAEKSCFVTFNGKSYDLPLLKSRFILNKIHLHTEQYSHIDLLHHCRRLWKKTAVSCSLSNIEWQVLGFQRQQHRRPGRVGTPGDLGGPDHRGDHRRDLRSAQGALRSRGPILSF